MEINAIDSHCHIRYAPKETIKNVPISKIMQEGPYYTAYWDELSQMEKAFILMVFKVDGRLTLTNFSQLPKVL